jgi:hypothetical protein
MLKRLDTRSDDFEEISVNTTRAICFLVCSLTSGLLSAQNCNWNLNEAGKITETGCYVGIGTTAPQAALHVVGSPSHALVGGVADFIGPGQTGYGATNGTEKLFFAVQPGLGFLGTVSSTNVGIVVGNWTWFYFVEGGKLGIANGINMPVSNLDVNGNASIGSYAGVHGAPPNGLVVSGNVGIGTYLPQSAFQVAGDVRFGSNGANTDLRIFTDSPGTLNGVAYAQINSVTPVTVPASGTLTRTAVYLKNATANGQGTNQIDLVVDGNIAAKYQDVAEWVPATTPMAPGTVVVLNREHRNEVMPSAQSYDTAVAGVVSAQPGLILGVAGESKVQVATTGRVKVRVDATADAIAIGDLLVTGNKSGTAMKSRAVDLGALKIHRPGTLIGKALEPLDRGEGEILVLLSLQ